jgi:hypothetical protein
MKPVCGSDSRRAASLPLDDRGLIVNLADRIDHDVRFLELNERSRIGRYQFGVGGKADQVRPGSAVAFVEADALRCRQSRCGWYLVGRQNGLARGGIPANGDEPESGTIETDGRQSTNR